MHYARAAAVGYKLGPQVELAHNNVDGNAPGEILSLATGLTRTPQPDGGTAYTGTIPTTSGDPGTPPSDDAILRIITNLRGGNDAIGPHKLNPPAGFHDSLKLHMTVGANGLVQRVSLTYRQQHTGSPTADGTYTWTIAYSHLGSTPRSRPRPPRPRGARSYPQVGEDGRLMTTRTTACIRLAGTLALVILIGAGCGSGAKTPGVANLGSTPKTSAGFPASAGTGSGNSQALAFAHCMRSHGIPNFPDPGGSFPPGIKQTPGFQPAMETCNKLHGTSQSTRQPSRRHNTTPPSHRPNASETTASRTSPTRRSQAVAGNSSQPSPTSTPPLQPSSTPLPHADSEDQSDSPREAEARSRCVTIGGATPSSGGTAPNPRASL